MSDEIPERAKNVAEANEEPQTPFLKLNVDCVDKWFEYLSVEDLLALRQTCKWMKVLVDEYINTHYPSAFKKFVIREKQPEMLRQSESSTFNLVKDVFFQASSRSERIIEAVVEPNTMLLSRLERLNVHTTYGNHRFEFYETFLKHCTQLKHLSVYEFYDDSPSEIGSDNSWLFRQYPTLDHIELDYSGYSSEIIDFLMFFELNPNIQKLTVHTNFLLPNQHWMMDSNIKLDLLVVDFSFQSCTYDFDSVRDSINELYDSGFYKRLHFISSNFELIPEFRMLNGLEILSLVCFLPGEDFDVAPLAQLTNLKELDCKDYGVGILNPAFAAHAQHFEHVEKIRYVEASLEDVLPFIHHLKQMKIIKIEKWLGGAHFHGIVIDVFTLNKERKKLDGARKITLYVPEKVFLATKWATDVNLELIEIKRCAEYERELFTLETK